MSNLDEQIRLVLENHEGLCQDQMVPCGDCRRLQDGIRALVAAELKAILERDGGSHWGDKTEATAYIEERLNALVKPLPGERTGE